MLHMLRRQTRTRHCIPAAVGRLGQRHGVGNSPVTLDPVPG